MIFTAQTQERQAPGAMPVLASLMPAFAAYCVAAVVYVLFAARNWPLVHDAPLMHYVIFLTRHGMVPYRDIVEMNLPGTYLVEGAVMRVFGGGATGWWLWDAALGAVAIGAGAWVAGRGLRSAGVAGASCAYLFHLSTGAQDLGQRDWCVAVLLLLTLGCGLSALRRRSAVWMAPFGFLGMTAAMIKPPSLLCVALFLALLAWASIRQKVRVLPLALWTCAGAVLPVLAASAALAHWHAFGDFLWTARVLVPYYAGLQQKPVGGLLHSAFPGRVLLPTLLVVLVARPWRRTETLLLAAGLLTGVVLFVSQRKGWPYHLYVEMLFLFLLLCFAAALALRTGGRVVQLISAAVLLFVGAAVVWPTAHRGAASWYPTATLTSLQQDLATLGGHALDGRVQCLDMADGGCINALYQSGITQATGFIYDYYLFPETPTAATNSLQPKFLSAMEQRPPRVIIQSADIFPGSTIGYGQVARWPAFADWLRGHYTLRKEQPTVGRNVGYRIYELNGIN